MPNAPISKNLAWGTMMSYKWLGIIFWHYFIQLSLSLFNKLASSLKKKKKEKEKKASSLSFNLLCLLPVSLDRKISLSQPIFSHKFPQQNTSANHELQKLTALSLSPSSLAFSAKFSLYLATHRVWVISMGSFVWTFQFWVMVVVVGCNRWWLVFTSLVGLIEER